MDKQKNYGQTGPAAGEAEETISLFGEKLDEATHCTPEADADSPREESPRKESQSELRDKA